MNTRFEKYAKDQFSGYEMPVDADALWAGIEPHVKPEKGNRKFLWVFTLGLLAGLSVFGVFYFDNLTTELSDQQAGPGYVAETESSEEKIIAETKATPEIKEAIDTDSNNTTNSTNKVAIASTTKEATSPSQKGFPAANNQTIKKQTPTAKAVPLSTTNTQTTFIQTKIPAVETPITNISENEKQIILSKSEDEATNAPLNIQRFSNAVSNLPPAIPAAYSSEFKFGDEAFMAMMKEQQAENMALLAKEKREELAKAKAAQKKKRRRGSFFRDLQFGLGVYGGIAQSTTTLEGGADDLTYELLRSNSEKQLETVHLGFSAMVLTEQKAYLRTGVEYTRIGSLFSRSATAVEIDSIDGIVEIQINAITGDTTLVTGQVPVTRTSNYTKKSYNYFHLIDVPVILGYNFGSDPWSIGVEGGVYANIMVKNKGEIAQPDESFYDKEEDPDGWYKNNIGISPFVGFNVGYKVTDNIQIHFSPSFRFPSTFSTSNNPLVEKHGTLGVSAGVRYLFDN